MRVRIEDVAQAAGVSMKTVSRVLNNETAVKEETRKRVLEVAGAMNYRPDPSARSLAGHKSYLIGLLYDNPSANYLMEILTGVVEACKENRYGMVLHPLLYDSPDFVQNVEDLMRSSKLDGLILTPPIADRVDLLDMLDARSVAYACVSPRYGEGRIGVNLNEHDAVCEMMAHLIGLGHTRIAHITSHPAHGAREWRLNGYRSGLRRAGIAYDPELVVEGKFTFESGVDAAEILFSRAKPPTAIFAANDDTAAGVMRVAHERGLAIPGDVSICGFDNLPMSKYIFPALTTIYQPTREMGHMATLQLLKSIKDRSAGQMVRMEYSLVLRQSTGAAPADSKHE
jgi:LacI family transcriptional regulator